MSYVYDLIVFFFFPFVFFLFFSLPPFLFFFFFFNDTAPPEISPLPLPAALPISDPVHRPRQLASRRRGRRLPLPGRRRSRIPPAQRPPRRVLLPDVPLDRAEDPRARLLLRTRSEEHTSELQSHLNIVCRLLLEKK